MRKSLMIISSLLISTSAFALQNYLICNLDGINTNVATLVISPEVKGKHYFTSYIGEKFYKTQRSTAIGPKELQVVKDGDMISLKMPLQPGANLFHFKSVKLHPTSESFYKLSSQDGEADLMISKKSLLGRLSTVKAPKETRVECYVMKPADFEAYYGHEDTSFINVDNSGVQHVDSKNEMYSRDAQPALLFNFLKSLK